MSFEPTAHSLRYLPVNSSHALLSSRALPDCLAFLDQVWRIPHVPCPPAEGDAQSGGDGRGGPSRRSESQATGGDRGGGFLLFTHLIERKAFLLGCAYLEHRSRRKFWHALDANPHCDGIGASIWCPVEEQVVIMM